MSLELLDAHQTAGGIAITLATDRGVEPLEGSCQEVARLARVMQQVAALAAINDTEQVWLEEVAVGEATVKLGLKPGGQARVRILRR
jgi:hypothetical protein